MGSMLTRLFTKTPLALFIEAGHGLAAQRRELRQCDPGHDLA